VTGTETLAGFATGCYQDSTDFSVGGDSDYQATIQAPGGTYSDQGTAKFGWFEKSGSSVAGEEGFTSSQAQTTPIAVPTTTTVTSSANPSVVGQAVTYTATISPAPDGGAVTFTDNGTTIAGCSAVPVSGATATCQATPGSTGAHNIVAAFNGSGGFEPSTSAALSQVVITANTVTVTNPGNQTGTAGTAASLQISATDSQAGQTFTFSATGLAAGLSINSSSGLISGTPTTAGTSNVTVTATDTTGASGSASFTWTIKPQTAACPAGTKANFRWHYTANGNAGGWSGTATQACPGSVSMGPQAMDGNLQVTPGTILQGGYDFTLPGNKNSLTTTVSGAQVTFAVACVSGATASQPTLTVPLSDQTYQITNDQWYPSGDQSSPLVYQGSVTVPDLCGGGKISLAKGGTFTATLG
jgi:Putative Ig domain